MCVVKSALALIVMLAAGMLALPTTAQEPQPAPGAVEEVPVTTVYLKDRDGNLVPVPGFSYEHYRDLVLQAEKSDTEPPAYSIEKLTLQGTIEEDICQLELDVVTHVRKSGWVMVPLRLPRAALRDAIAGSVDPKPASPAETVNLIHRFDAKEGHVVWLWGVKDRRHTLRLPLTTQLVHAAGEEQLSVSLPRASETRLSIDVPYLIDSAMAKSGDGLVETTPRDGRSQVTVTGATGELTLAWRSEEEATVARVLDLDAASDISVNVETRDTIGFSAKMHVSRAGGLVRRLFVRLPPQTDLVPRRARDFTTALATADDLSEAGFDPQRFANVAVARVDFEKPAENSDVTLEAAYKAAATERRGAIELAGFEVLGAGRQTGFVTISAPAGWSLKATPDAAAFRTDEESSLLGPSRATARYRFVRQPFSLPVEVAPQPPRTVVEPTYIATVQPQRVTMSATLDYEVRGPRPPFVEISLADWKLDSAGPESLVDFEPPESDVVRLNLQPGPGGEFSLQLELHRDVPADNLDLDFALPRASATQVLPATLLVTALENVVLTPQNDQLRSLVAETRTSQLPPGVAARALVYRELPASAESPRFVATCQVRKRRVTAIVDGRAQIGPQKADVEQNLSLQVAYEPLSILTLDAPADATLGDLRVSQSGQLLDVREESLGNVSGLPTRRWRVELLEPVLGAVDLSVRYRLSLPKEGNLQLPLLAVAEEEGIVTARQQLLLAKAAEGQLAFAPTQPDGPAVSVSDTPQGTLLIWPRRASRLELARTLNGSAAGPALRIERQWLQLWLSPSAQRDRLVARVEGAGEQLSVALPTGVAAEDITVLVDGQPPRSLKLEGQTLVIRIEPSAGNHRTVELWYLLPGKTASLLPQQRTLELPRIQGAAAPSQCWLQVVTPASEQVLYSPSPVASEQTWRKQGLLWKRAGALTTAELEEWAGAQQAENLFAETNEALYMTLGQAPLLDVVVWGSRWLWLCAAGGVFLAGMLAQYISRGRLMVVIGGLGGLALLATLMAPEIMLCVSQYAGAGVLLLVAVMWSLRISGSAAPAAYRHSASLAQRAEQPRSDSRSGRRGSTLTPGRKELATTTAGEAQS